MTLSACSGTLRAILSTGIWDYVWKSLTALVAIGAAIFVSVSRQDSTSLKSRFSTPGLTQAPGQVRNGKPGFITTVKNRTGSWLLLSNPTSAGNSSLRCPSCRIYLGYHTMEQILYGVMIGLFLGAVWFALVQVGSSTKVEKMCQRPCLMNYSISPQLVFGPYFPHIYSW